MERVPQTVRSNSLFQSLKWQATPRSLRFNLFDCSGASFALRYIGVEIQARNRKMQLAVGANTMARSDAVAGQEKDQILRRG